MICKRCGNNIGENDKFCTACGFGIEEMEKADGIEVQNINEQDISSANDIEVQTANEQEANSENEGQAIFIAEENNDEEQKPKKRIKKRILIPIICAVLAAIFAITAFATPAAPYIQNAFYETFLSSEDYLKHVLKKGVNDSTKTIDELCKTYGDLFKGDKEAGADLKLELKDKGKDIFKEMGMMPNEDINRLESAGFNYDFIIKDGNVLYDVGYEVNDTEIDSQKTIITDKEVYEVRPYLNKKAIRYEFEDSFEGLNGLKQFCDTIPEEKVLKEIYRRYFNLIIAQIEDVEKDEEKVNAGGVAQKLTKLTATIDEDVLKNSMIAVLKEAKNDKKLKEMIKSFDKMDAVKELDIDIYDEMQNAIDEALKWVKKDFELGIDDFEVSFYADGKGNIVGIEAEIEDFKGLAVATKKGTQSGRCIELDMPGGISASYEASGKTKANRLTGDGALKVMGMDIINIDFADINVKKLEKEGILEGTISFRADKNAVGMLYMASEVNEDLIDILKNAKITLTGKEDKKQGVIYDISFKRGKDALASVKIRLLLKDKAEDIELPKKYVDSDDEKKMEKWYEDCDFYASQRNLEKALSKDDGGWKFGKAEEWEYDAEATETAFPDDYYYSY